MMDYNRQPSGIPSGGQFSPSSKRRGEQRRPLEVSRHDTRLTDLDITDNANLELQKTLTAYRQWDKLRQVISVALVNPELDNQTEVAAAISGELDIPLIKIASTDGIPLSTTIQHFPHYQLGEPLHLASYRQTRPGRGVILFQDVDCLDFVDSQTLADFLNVDHHPYLVMCSASKLELLDRRVYDGCSQVIFTTTNGQ